MKTKRFLKIFFCLKFIWIMLTIGSLLLIPFFLNGQNIGIGTDNPTEKLEVAGKVFSSDEGFKFPDGSVQTRAYNAYETQDAAEGRWVIALENAQLPGSDTIGALQNVIKVIDFDWGLYHNISEIVPITDKCHLKLITITKEIDKSSPKFPQFWSNFTNLGQAIFHFYWYTANDQSYTEYYKITFAQIQVVKININQTYIGNDQYAHTEKITFYFSGHVLFYWFGPPVVQDDWNPVLCGGM